MTNPAPASLSPSRVEAFTSCPLAFRFANIDKLPEPPNVHTTKGSLVHRALELLFTHPPAQRDVATLHGAFDQAVAEFQSDPEFVFLDLDEAEEAAFVDDAWSLAENYLRMEDPAGVREIGLELRLEAQVGDLALRGIIDRLELDEQGELVVTDYKTGRSPGERYEQSSLGGVHFYSFLCESVLGRRPAAIRLMYLRSGEILTAIPSPQSVRFITTRTTAVWKAVERACTTEDFRPRPSALCSSCAFQQWCPEFGGDPALAAVEAPLLFGRLAAA
jgi:putative RecB family exonuclease